MEKPRLAGQEASDAVPGVGLCAGCGHARRQRSANDSLYWRCALADRDARFLKYPPLPVRECEGFEAMRH